jgi:CRP-like cAMP-binding protein
MLPISTLKLTRHYKRRSYLFREGEPCDGTFVVLDGDVALSTANASRRPIDLGYVRAGAVIGLCETIGASTYQTSAVAKTDVTVHLIPKRDVLSLISDDPATGMHVLQMLVGDFSGLYSRIRRMRCRRERSLARLLQ